MFNRHLERGASAIAMAVAAGSLAAPLPAFGQAVTDRTLSDVRTEQTGGCTVVTVNFNIRVQMLSYFPQVAGREVHVRIKALDTANINALRESLRTPASLPELRSIEYEGDNPSGPVLSMFFTKPMRFDVAPGAQPQSLIFRLAAPGPGPLCAAAPATVQPAVEPPHEEGAVAPAPAPAPGIPIPPGLYTINVASKPGAMGELTAGQKAAIEGKVVYETRFERDSQQWRRLRLGFFETREAAEAAKAALAGQFPDAWVVKVSADERAQGVANRIATGGDRGAAAVTPQTPASEADSSETARLVADAETAIGSGDNDRAIQLLTNATAKPENETTPRALELLGLTRERKGQLAHAQAEYEEYLRRYPSGEAADRVRQRLAAIKTPGSGTQTPELRQASGSDRSATAWSWGLRGSFSQFYFRDQSSTKFTDASRPDINAEVDNAVNLNQLLSSADITVSGGNDRRQLQLRAAGSYSYDFRPPSKLIGTDPVTGARILARNHIKSLTAFYLDYVENNLGTSLRIGRQTRNSSGVLGRFDGALLGWQAKPSIRLNLVGGFPVLSSRQTYILRDRFFYGASLDFGSKRSPFQTTLYWFDQHAQGGFVDRRSVGLEARYLNSRFNAYTIVDYDVHYRKLNLGLLTLNYSFPDSSNISVTADYRQSPLLTTSNALIGQANPVTFEPVTNLRGLRQFFTDGDIYQLARDRTLLAKSLTVAYSRPITKKLQTNFDVTLTDTGGTPASGGVPELPATGKEYYYGAQLIGSGIFWSSDIYILSGRYADTQRSRTYTADFTARVPITSNVRFSPRIRYGLRNDKFLDSKFRQWQPTMRFNYYPMRNSEVEIELGGNFSRQRQMTAGMLSTTRETGVVVSAGYRIDF